MSLWSQFSVRYVLLSKLLKEDTKEVIIVCKSKDRQYNDQNEKGYRSINNDQQNLDIQQHTKTEVNSCALEGKEFLLH